ncbi:LysR family transcriptional regulator [Ochrobactrum sp. Q0168]|uniref:LysR substrate-binding domain-containing protein n=1 Tax=Ochrobactrum sp. Q0168 TaxID=2793241 RepID=UPI0018EB9604|nr:LysR family transcriptional regulator [Ochrobactrum sp. Q0168]
MDWLRKIRVRHLDMLISLSRTLNVTRTADELHMHQSGVSKMLRELEDDLNLVLFDRGSKGLLLNEHGRAACAHAVRIRTALTSFRDEMEVLANKGSALISVGFAGASSIDALPMALLSVLHSVPRTHIRITEGAVSLLQTKLIDYEIDLLVAQTGLHFDPSLGISEEALYADSICVAARADHPLATKSSITWDDIVAYPLAVWSAGTPTRFALERALARNNWSLPSAFLESNSASINMNLIVNSDMVGFSMLRGASLYAAHGILSILSFDLEEVGIMSVYWRKSDEIRKPIAQLLTKLSQMPTGLEMASHEG